MDNGDKIYGKIIKMDEDSITVITKNKEMIIDRSDIIQIFRSTDDYNKFLKTEKKESKTTKKGKLKSKRFSGNNDDMNRSFIDEYIIDKNRPSEFIELSESGYNKTVIVPNSISKKQLLEDIKILRYILNNGYSGRDFWSKNGVDFELMFKKLEDLTYKSNEISISSIEKILIESFKDIVDGSFGIYGKNINRFYKHKDVYFTDILIEKRGNNYFVINSKQKDIKEGMRFNDSNDLLFKTLSPKDKEHYLIGKLSYDKITRLNVRFDNKEYKLNLHTCRLNESYFRDDKAFYLDEIENIPLIHVTSFDSKYNMELTDFVKYGRKLRKYQFFILNLCNNRGGDSSYPSNFFKNIVNINISIQGIFAELISPVTVQGQVHRYKSLENPTSRWKEMMKRVYKLLSEQKDNPKYYWQITDDYTKKYSIGRYKGLAIILINRKSGGSAEIAVNYSKRLKNSILIGENSIGGGSFRDNCLYILPNSKIKLQLPFKLVLIKGFYEGIGFMPDYWLDSKSPVNEILSWINNPEDYVFDLK